MLHLLELILGAVITYLIGTAKGYRNEIFEQLKNCEQKEIIKFTPISLEHMPQPLVGENGGDGMFDWSRVTNDQKVLLNL